MLQRDAYVNAINNVLPTDGSVAVGVWVFGNNTQLVFATAVITGANIGALTGAIAALPTANTDPPRTWGITNTAIGTAINIAGGAPLGNAIDSDRQVIDVSTDGANNSDLTRLRQPQTRSRRASIRSTVWALVLARSATSSLVRDHSPIRRRTLQISRWRWSGSWRARPGFRSLDRSLSRASPWPGWRSSVGGGLSSV